MATLATIARCYESLNRGFLADLLDYYREKPALADAVRAAAWGLMRGEKRHPHQRRIKKAAMDAAERRLFDADLESSPDFETLYERIEAAVEDIDGLGTLYAYDASLRIGAYLGIGPKSVYLHAGTKEGARALGLDVSSGRLCKENLPTALQTLPAAEIEDLLCIYKDDLKHLGEEEPNSRRRRSKSGNRRCGL